MFFDLKPRARYYRLLGRGIRYRILNDLERHFGQEGTVLGIRAFGQMKYPRRQAERVELVAELMAQGVSLKDRYLSVKKSLESLKKKMGPLGIKQFKPFSYTALQFKRYKQEMAHLQDLVAEFGLAPDLDDVLHELAGDHYRLLPTDESIDLESLFAEAPEVRASWELRNESQRSLLKC